MTEKSETTKARRLRLRGERLIRTQISLKPGFKAALENVAKDEGVSASMIIHGLLEADHRIQQYLKDHE